MYVYDMKKRSMQEPTFLILTALAAGPQHGYGIITDAERISGGVTRLQTGTLYMALDRLRDPDRFGAWLGGIIRNVHRAAAREAPLMLLAEWPEGLHPVSAQGLPSADDLDRAEALRAAVSDLPDGQRRAVELYYYADLPAGQIGGSPGAAKASLHKARRRLRARRRRHGDRIHGGRAYPGRPRCAAPASRRRSCGGVIYGTRSDHPSVAARQEVTCALPARL